MSTTQEHTPPLDLQAQAEALDRDDGLKHLRNEFVIPSLADIKRNTIQKGITARHCSRLCQAEHCADAVVPGQTQDSTSCTYLCGNSLGLQPKRTRTRLQQYLDTWGTQGVQGHFKIFDDSPLPTWLDADAHVARKMAPIVGADESQVAVMQTLTANLHLLMTAFYNPDPNGKHKIILENKAFPSDHVRIQNRCCIGHSC